MQPTVKNFLFFSDFGQKHLRVSFDFDKGCRNRIGARRQELGASRGNLEGKSGYAKSSDDRFCHCGARFIRNVSNSS